MLSLGLVRLAAVSLLAILASSACGGATGPGPAPDDGGQQMPQSLVEIHVPLVPDPDLAPGAYPFPWIDAVEEHLVSNQDDRFEVYDEGEELGAEYLFFIVGDDADTLIEVATEVAALPGIPAGTFAVVADTDQEEMGVGRRVELAVD